MFEYVNVLSQLPNVVKWDKYSYYMESMLIAREKGDIISYVDFSKKNHVIRCFPDLYQIFGKEDIMFSLLSISRSNEWRKHHLNQLDQYVYIIYTSLYKYFRINKK